MLRSKYEDERRKTLKNLFLIVEKREEDNYHHLKNNLETHHLNANKITIDIKKHNLTVRNFFFTFGPEEIVIRTHMFRIEKLSI